jgi:N6-adenosine-specific RNA methylase IME4
MDVTGIAALPVASIAARDSVLLMWATMPTLPDALRVIVAWGFTYKTAVFTWVKMTAKGDPFMGLGYYTRANAELCLLATRGKGLPRCDKGVPSVLMSRRREHSRKPDGAYDYLDRLFGTSIRRVELFARTAWPGWTAWGFDAPDVAPLGLPLEGVA